MKTSYRITFNIDTDDYVQSLGEIIDLLSENLEKFELEAVNFIIPH